MNALKRRFDRETGRELDESILREVAEQDAQKLEQGDALAALRPMPGWKIIEEFCNLQIEAAKNNLLDAKDLDEIRRHQAFATAFARLLGSMDTVIREAEEIREINNQQERELENSDHNSMKEPRE